MGFTADPVTKGTCGTGPCDATHAARQGGPLPKRIAVVGGGIAGLSGADQARGLGLDAHVFEAHAGPGSMLRTVAAYGKPHDLGAICGAGREYDSIRSISARAAAVYRAPPAECLTLSGQRKRLGPWGLAGLVREVTRYLFHRKKTWGLQADCIESVHPDLQLPLRDWAEKYGFERLVDLAKPALTPMGYGDASIPAIYFVKYITAELLQGACFADPKMVSATAMGLLRGRGFYPGLIFWRHGLQAVWEDAARRIPSDRLHLDATVLRLRAGPQATTVTWTERGERRSDDFDAVLWTGDPSGLLATLDEPTEAQKRYLDPSHFGHVDYRVYLIGAPPRDGRPRPEEIVFHDAGDRFDDFAGRVLARVHRYAEDPVYALYVQARPETTEADVERTVREYAVQFGADPRRVEVLARNRVPHYFPHGKGDLDALYRGLASIQGQGRVWLAGQLMEFSDMPRTVANARMTVRRVQRALNEDISP